MPFVTIDGVRIFYEMAGSGHPVVFLHGHALDSRIWQGQMAGLGRLYTVIRYDARGHGQSEAPPTGYSRAHYAAELLGFINALGLSKPSLVGHSMGGAVALEYALQHADRCSTLSLIGSGLEGYSYQESMSETVNKQKDVLRRDGVSEKFLRVALFSPLYQGVRQDPEKLALLRSMLSGWSGASWLDTAVHPTPDRTQLERLRELGVPALVAVGERDLPFFHEVAEALTIGIRVVRKMTVPEAGHMAPLENPAAVNDILIDFIGGAAGKALL